MIIRELDFLSPKITLYFKGTYKHSSIFSGIITILSYLIILVCIVYYTLDFIDRENPTIYFFNRYIEEAGTFALNASSLFHYINLVPASRDKNITLDFSSISFYGINRSIDTYLQGFDFSKNYHWVYGLCDNKDYDMNNNEFNNIINKNIFYQSACIKRFYNYKAKRYFDIGESGFVWPTLDHGASNPNRTIYGIIIEKCQNDSLKNNCNSKDKINSYLRKYAISLNFIDQYADVLNYKQPFIKYIYSISSGLTSGTTITNNNLNFNPSITRTHNGIFFENVVEEKSYSLAQNEKKTLEKKVDYTLTAFYFWMQNNMIYNERHYKKFQDLLPNIGGLGSFILLIGFFINSFVSYYVILLDTEDLVFNIEKLSLDRDKIIKSPITITKDNKTIFNVKNKNINNTLQNSNLHLFMNDYNNYNNNNKNEKEIKLEPFKLFITKKNKENKHGKKYSCAQFAKTPLFKENLKIKQTILSKSNSDNLIQRIDLEKSFFEIKDKNNNVIPKPIQKQNFTWFSYILYIILFKRKNTKIKFYENFRAKILSEENFWQNNLEIYKLLEFCNIKKNSLFESNEINKN